MAAEDEDKELQDKQNRGTRGVFKKGQKVLVPHTDQYYAAQVLRSQKREDGHYYLVHYEGWSKKYDEWVEQAGLVRYDKTLLDQSAAAKAGGEGGAGGAPGPAIPAGARKRKADIALEVAAAGGMPSVLRLHMPPMLKKVLLDDFKQHNVVGTLLPLPRKAHGRPTVSDILKEFTKEAAKEAAKEAVKDAAADGEGGSSSIDSGVEEVVAGLRSYFDKGLRHFLLYQHEVAAATAALAGGAAPCDVFGGEHLLRLLVKLPELVPVAYISPPDIVRLESRLQQLMARMTQIKHQARYFCMPEEYKPNPEFSPDLVPLTWKALFTMPPSGPGASPTPGGATPGGASRGGAATTAAAAAGGDTPAAGGTRANSEAPHG